MPFIGNQPAEAYSSFQKQDFTTSATTSYTLDHPVANGNEIALFINFVRQEPTAAYTASGTSLTLTSATTSSDDMYCVYLGKAVQTVNPPNSSVGSSQVSADLITGQTALGATPADTDELLISDAGTLKRVDYSYLKQANTPAWFVTKTAFQSISHNTETVVSFETEEIDTDNAFSSNTTFTVPSGKAGKYFAFGQVRFETTSNFAYINAMIQHNSTNVTAAWNSNNDPSGYSTITVHCMVDLAESDTLKLICRQQSGGALNLGHFDRGHVVYFGGYKLIGV